MHTRSTLWLLGLCTFGCDEADVDVTSFSSVDEVGDLVTCFALVEYGCAEVEACGLAIWEGASQRGCHNDVFVM
jgi:hypothetical protein